MSISDFALAIKKDAFGQMLPEDQELLHKSSERWEREEGYLFVYRSENVYSDMYFGMRSQLRNLDDEDYLFLDACEEYPTADEYDCGSWANNPWGLRKVVSVHLEYSSP